RLRKRLNQVPSGANSDGYNVSVICTGGGRMMEVRIGLCLLVFVLRALAQDSPAGVDQYIHAEMNRRQIPGLALLVVHEGKIVKQQGYGLANVELKVPAKPETLFQSGSMGKQFTAAAIMMLVEEGKIGLDDPLTKYFPGAPTNWKKVTVKNLLSHTGGFGDYPKKFDFRKDYTENELLKIVEGIPLGFEPGTKWTYSNLGYLTLGVLIHKVTGRFYGDVLQERIFKPLGMSTTRIINEADIIPNRSAGYRLVKKTLKNQEWVSPTLNTTADGSLYFSIVDLAKWDAALSERKLLKPESYELMWTPVNLRDGKPNKDGYGFGWFIHQLQGDRVIEREGAWQGVTTNISRYVDDKVTIVVMPKLAGAEPADITHHVAGLY